MQQNPCAERRFFAERIIPTFGNNAEEMRFFDGTVTLFDHDAPVFCDVEVWSIYVDICVIFWVRKRVEKVVLSLFCAASVEQRRGREEQCEEKKTKRKRRGALAHGWWSQRKTQRKKAQKLRAKGNDRSRCNDCNARRNNGAPMRRIFA